jgi:hypothetical protein
MTAIPRDLGIVQRRGKVVIGKKRDSLKTLILGVVEFEKKLEISMSF